jgi:FAD/FMN-containing dehydrogenase/formate hydrogenlyase subunit 6/NADH:ubiquinone oxidoreductase subunit I
MELVLAWARRRRIGIATRGAGSTAMGGAVPNNGGLLLDMSRYDQIQVDARDRVAVVGAGARFKQIHEKLAKAGLALKTYPSNLGGTLAGWFSAGGLGLNSFKYGRVQNQVRALAAVLPRGEHVRFHDDGRLDVLSGDRNAHRFTPEQAEQWLSERGYPVLRLNDLAQTEGQLGVLLSFTMEVIPLPRMRPFYFEFESDAEALHFLKWVQDTAEPRGFPPTNLKFLSREHVGAVRAVRGENGATASTGVYVDFDDVIEAQRFEAELDAGKWSVRRDAAEAWRWFDDRFRPQQTKRLGPGFLAAEILLPAQHVEHFLERARALAHGVGVHLEAEVYFFNDARALALPGYLTRGRRPGFVFELLLAPMLVDLAMARYDGQPYVLGRWQSAFFNSVHPAGEARQLRRAKRATDPKWTLNPGAYFQPRFRVRGADVLFRSTFRPVLRLMRALYGARGIQRVVRAFIQRGGLPNHAAHAAGAVASEADGAAISTAATIKALAQQTVGCVNCGECNAVCPIFHDAKIRLPQMLTHIGEGLGAKSQLTATPQLLLDMCMRCGNCEEVCQASIPHLDLYDAMEQRSGRYDAPRRERHTTILAHLRYSERYTREFLGVRPGGYLHRTPASLPGELRFVLLRAQNDAGAEATCIHCAACVPACPTHANNQYEDASDLRRITTNLERCIGCGACVEICPANLKNGGRTLRVMEAPSNEFFDVLATLSTAASKGDA